MGARAGGWAGGDVFERSGASGAGNVCIFTPPATGSRPLDGDLNLSWPLPVAINVFELNPNWRPRWLVGKPVSSSNSPPNRPPTLP